MPAPIPTDTVRTQSERKASPTARGPWPRSQSETTPTTTRTGVALNGRIPANPAARIAAATRSSGSRNRCARGRSRTPPGVTPMPEDPMDRGGYHTVGHRTNDDADGRPDGGRPPSLSRARKDGGARAGRPNRARAPGHYRADGTISTVGPDDELDGEDVLPGFRCPLRDIL